MQPTGIVRSIGAAIVIGFPSYIVFEYYRITKGSNVALSSNEPNEIEFASDLHMHDTYYIIMDYSDFHFVTAAVIVGLGLACVCFPRRVTSLLRIDKNKV